MTYGLDEDFTDWILQTGYFYGQMILSTVGGAWQSICHDNDH